MLRHHFKPRYSPFPRAVVRVFCLGGGAEACLLVPFCTFLTPVLASFLTPAPVAPLEALLGAPCCFLTAGLWTPDALACGLHVFSFFLTGTETGAEHSDMLEMKMEWKPAEPQTERQTERETIRQTDKWTWSFGKTNSFIQLQLTNSESVQLEIKHGALYTISQSGKTKWHFKSQETRKSFFISMALSRKFSSCKPTVKSWSVVIYLCKVLKTRQARRNTAEMSKMLSTHLGTPWKQCIATSSDILTTLTKGKSNGSDGTWEIFWAQTILLEKKKREKSLENGLDVSFSSFCRRSRQTHRLTNMTKSTKTDSQNATSSMLLFLNKSHVQDTPAYSPTTVECWLDTAECKSLYLLHIERVNIYYLIVPLFYIL